jgi:hypothetical protein
MRCAAWFLLILWTSGGNRAAGLAFAPRDVPSSFEGVTLSAFILRKSPQDYFLQLSLHNDGTRAVTILTGMDTGNAQYPAMNFTYTLEVDGLELSLQCVTCAPGVVAGAIAPHQVTLAPGSSFKFDLALASTWYKNQPVCPRQTSAARLTVTLKGYPWAYGVDPAVYWKGTVSDTVPFTCPRT